MDSRIKASTPKRGIGTVTSVFMLLLMFAAITGLITVYFSYNLSAQEQMKFEEERSKEKIVFTQMEVEETSVIITTLTVRNEGTIEVRIRALYTEKNGMVSFISDPSTYMDTHIQPGKSLTLEVHPETPFENANIIAATERGTTTIEYEPLLLFTLDESQITPGELTIGPLLLKFTAFNWTRTKNGGLDPSDTWHDGWVINTTTQSAWKITVKNVDDRTTSIVLNNYSSFNTVTADGPASTLNWYLSTPTLELPYDETADIIFMYESWNDNRLVSIYSTECSAKIFLTFFGRFIWADGKPDSPYAQTIPFEAIFVVKKSGG